MVRIVQIISMSTGFRLLLHQNPVYMDSFSQLEVCGASRPRRRRGSDSPGKAQLRAEELRGFGASSAYTSLIYRGLHNYLYHFWGSFCMFIV